MVRATLYRSENLLGLEAFVKFHRRAAKGRPVENGEPADDAQPLQAYASSDAPLLLVVPDGTWRKARKMLHLNPLLAALPRVTLAEGGVSRYRLRKAPGPGALSTVEAIVQALQVLEAPTSFEALLKPFEALIDGQIAAMGDEVFQRNHGDRSVDT